MIGEGEKLVRALFGVASCRQPAVIFVDEIDSLLSQPIKATWIYCRSSFSDIMSHSRIVYEERKSDGEHESSRRLKTQFLIEMEGFDSGATNRPQELDEAARRRLTKRLYIPLPSSGYSGSDMKNLVKDASMGPLREALRQGIEITKLKKEDMRGVTLQDFENSLREVRPSVSPNELGTYDQWNKQFGSLSLEGEKVKERRVTATARRCTFTKNSLPNAQATPLRGKLKCRPYRRAVEPSEELSGQRVAALRGDVRCRTYRRAVNPSPRGHKNTLFTPWRRILDAEAPIYQF
ncbi:hypothetical protein V8G54_012980 [Vigna mungo]|uniref:Uncharacterized protein n=1 Tax=Vigna mungo TaxID=3915 RepID=A0AAQ3S139_VIGMU